MLHRIIPIIVLFLSSFTAFSQTPEVARLESPDQVQAGTRTPLACDAGDNPFGGTSTQALGFAAQSNDILFLCFGDTLLIDHNQDSNLGGDPNLATPAGIAYSLYAPCPPTVTGPDLATIKADDGCLLNTPPPGPNTIYVYSEGLQANGDGFFTNQGGYQNAFNGGDPFQIYFAPITVDDFIPGNTGWEDNGSGERGACLHANIDDNFSVVLLNEIQASNIVPGFGGNGCTASMTITGGLPEYQTNTNYAISIYMTSDPSIAGYSADADNTSHGDDFRFSVPVPGTYTVEVRDNKGCGSDFQIDMAGCVPVTFTIGDSLAMPGENICMPVVVENFTNIRSLQFFIRWDETILDFTGVSTTATATNGNPVQVQVGPPDPADSVRIIWSTADFDIVNLIDGAAAFEICFDVIGPLGSSSPLFIDESYRVEISGDDLFNLNFFGYTTNPGSVTITDGNIVIQTLSTCGAQAGTVDGGASINVDGGVAPYTFVYEEVGNAANTGTGNIAANNVETVITDLSPGNYSITVTDDSGAVSVGSFTIDVTTQSFGSTMDEDPPTCANNSDGSVTVNIFGGVAPYTVEWSNAVVNNNVTGSDMITGLPVGNYDVTITDANGCKHLDGTSLINSNVVVDSIDLQHVSCIGGGMDGTITVAGSGGNGTFTYIWDSGETTASISNKIPGNYCVTVMDGNMCPAVRCFEILAPVEPVIDSITVSEVLCPNDMNGSLTVNFTEANSPVNLFTWDNGGNTQTIDNLGPGEYKVTITATDGCTDSSMISIVTPPEIALTFNAVPPQCPTSMTGGTIELMPTGATTPYQVFWEDGNTNFVRPGLACDSTYTVSVTGANGCDTIVEQIFLPCPPSIGVVFTDTVGTNCGGPGGSNDGQAMATAFGGTSTAGVYNYEWVSSGETTPNAVSSTATMLSPGWNIININDNICSYTDSVFISSPPAINVPLDDITFVDVSCLGGNDGSITIAASGGTPGYTYNWQGGVTGSTIDNQMAGIVSVTITDANSCSLVTNLEINEPDLLEIFVDSTQLQQVGCEGDSSGLISLFALGGNTLTGPTTYEWTDGVSTSSVASNLKAGTYSVTATDHRGCTATTLVTLTEPDPIEFDIADIVEPECFGYQTVITIDTAFGGNGPLYEFSINNGPKRPIQGAIPVLGGQNNLVTVFDRNGCREEEEVFVDQPALLVVDLGNDTIIELGETLTLDPFIGSLLPIDSVVWQPTNVTCVDTVTCLEVEVSPLETQMYTLMVFDTMGCSGSDEIIVEVDKNRNVFIPNVFSPNGDGLNDLFKPFVGAGVQNINYMRVFDRWGEVLYERAGQYLPDPLDLTGWDGKLKGKRMNPGVYVYLIEVQFVDGQVLLYRGDVTLLY